MPRYSGEIAAAAYEAAKEANAHGWRPLVEPSIEDRRWLAEVLLCRMPKTPIFSQLHAGILATKKVLDKQVSALNDLERAPDVAAAVAAAHGASNCGVPADVIQERLDEWAAGHLTGLSFVVS